MADKDHWGKIATHLPNRGNPNADVWNIEFRPKNGNANLEIDRVYMVPPSVSVTTIPELQHYIVWTTDVTLVPESDAVCIEFIPNADISLENVAIFSVDGVSGNTINFAIYHESGLLVAKSTNGSQTPMTKFEQSGKRWLTAVSGVTLKKGLKYYIQFTGGSNNDIIKPVAMDGWYGNYKKFTHGQAQNKSVANLNNAHNWLGTIDSSTGIFAMTSGDFFMWDSSGWTPGLNNGHIYMRSNLGAGMQFSGVVGNPQSQTTVTSADITALLAKPAGSAFIWYIRDYPSMNSGSIWQIPSSMPTATIDFTGYNDGYPQLVHLLYALQGNVSEVICNGGQWQWGTGMGKTFSLKSGYVNMVTSETPLSEPPADPVEKGVYYTNQYGWDHLIIWDYDEDNERWYWRTPSDQGAAVSLLINVEGLNDLLTYVGENSDLTSADWDGNYQSDGLRTATLYTDQKHYLEINGTEV